MACDIENHSSDENFNTAKNTKTQRMMIPSASRTELLLDIEGKGARISRHIAFFWCNEISDKLGRSQIW